MSVLKGHFRSTNSADFAGYRVQALFDEQIAMPTAPASTTTLPDGTSAPATPAIEAVFAPAVRSGSVASDGAFSLELPDTDSIGSSVVVELLAPDGEKLVRAEFLNAEAFGDDLSIEAAPRAATVPGTGNPEDAQRIRLTGRVLDAGGERLAADLQVVLMARPEADEGDDGDGDADGEEVPFNAVLVARTDANGYFFGAYPRGFFGEAHGLIGVEGGKTVTVPLEDGAFPRHVLLVLDLPAELEGAHKCDCESGETVPRAPDPIDLVNAPETFSTDLRGGKCVDFTAPNRALEEFNFYKIVRTTDPVIKGLTIEEPRHVPPGVLTAMLDNFSLSAQSIFSDTSGNGGARRFVRSGGRFSDGAEREGNTLTMSAEAFDGEGMARFVGLDAGAAAVSLRVLESLTERVAKTPQSLQIQPQILKELAQDPDGFTPLKLMTAERLSVHSRLRDLLGTLIKPVTGRGELNEKNSVDWDDDPTFYQAATIAHGHLLHFKQVWRADGYSLGDLLYSLPLAPAQKKQIVIVDWERRETAARTEQLDASEEMDASFSRDRDISEIVHATASEQMRGGSSARTSAFGGGLGLAIGPLVLGAAGGSSSASSSAWQNSARQTAADSLQQLRDRTVQGASAVRSQRSTVVQTAQQGESTRVQSEVVANYNHCHAMTIEYFEVLRHFQISQELTDVQECLFVPLMMSRFDAFKALRWRESLLRFLRNRALRGGFDALERIRNSYQGSDLPLGTYAEETLEDLDGELRISFILARPQDGVDDAIDAARWNVFTPFLWASPASIFNNFFLGRVQAERDRIWQREIAPRIAEKFVQTLKFFAVDNSGVAREVQMDATLVSRYAPDVPLAVSLRPVSTPPSVRRIDVRRFEIQATAGLPPDSRALVHSATMRYRTTHLSYWLLRDARVMNDLKVGDAAVIPTPLDRAELRNPREEDREVSRKLLAHLNEHLEHYHKACWRMMDDDRRYMLLDGFVAPHSGGRSVASVVENRLIGIVGNSLVMPVARGFKLDPTYKQEGENPPNLLEHYAPTTPIPPMRVSVPTKGVFAEAVMGACNSCELKEEARFWRWEESPSPDDPTAILPVGTESRRSEAPNLEAKDFAAPIIAMQSAPAAPDPTGLGAALQLLGNANLFRDITGLSENQKNALAGLQAAFGAASGFGSEAVKFAATQNSRKDIGKTMEAVNRARKDGLINEEQASQITQDALKSMVDGGGKSATPITEQPEVKELLRSTTNSPNSDVSVQTPDGQSLNVKKDSGGPD